MRMLDVLFRNWDNDPFTCVDYQKSTHSTQSLSLNFLRLLVPLNLHSLLKRMEGTVKRLE